MKSYYFYGVDEYGNMHAFRSKGYRNELIDSGKIRLLTFVEYHKVINEPVPAYLLVHNTNDLDTYNLIRVK